MVQSVIHQNKGVDISCVYLTKVETEKVASERVLEQVCSNDFFVTGWWKDGCTSVVNHKISSLNLPLLVQNPGLTDESNEINCHAPASGTRRNIAIDIYGVNTHF